MSKNKSIDRHRLLRIVQRALINYSWITGISSIPGVPYIVVNSVVYKHGRTTPSPRVIYRRGYHGLQ